ncbi:MAG: response regulator [Candidatus Dormibacteraeota bacterium]|nr:response regulator [Candidatus Dormibacteraeota bacterium]
MGLPILLTVTMPRILIADDEPRLVHIVSMYLSMEGFEVAGAADGLEALRLLEREPFDLVLLDVMMPRCDGIEVLRRMRAEPRTRDIPVLVFTSLSGDADVERARLAGANRLITKPFSLPGLGKVIRSSFAKTPVAGA